MIPDQAFSELIGRIYDCALDNALWPEVLGEITEALHGETGDLTVVDPIRNEWQLAAQYNWPEDVARLAVEHGSINPNLAFIFTMPVLEPKCSSRDLDIVAFHQSRYWRTCFAGRGYYDYLVTALSRQQTRLSGWGVLGSESRGPFQDHDLELARLLSPHIRRSTEISGVLEHRRVEAGTLRSALDLLVAPALIIDPSGEIRFLNAAARTEIEGGGLFHEGRNRLLGATPEATALLAEVRADPQRGRDAVLTDASGRTLHATWASLEQAGEELGSPILLVLRQPEPELTTPISAAATAFRLTTAETQVLAQVLESRPLAEIADLIGVARSTVKTHLDAIYRKTETRRQTELVRLILGLASPLKQ